MDTPNTEMVDRLLSWLDIGTSMKSLRAQTSPLREISLFKIQFSVLEYYTAHIIVISYKSNVFYPFNSLEIAHFTLNNNHLRLSKL